MGRLAVVIPICGRDHLTYRLLSDVFTEREFVDIVIIDNGGAYKGAGPEAVVRSGKNLGWAAGCNLGMQWAAAELAPAAYVLLNNDTRLSPNFFLGLMAAHQETTASLVAPTYDGYWPHQQTTFHGPAASYVATATHRRVSFVDGTCMFIPDATYREIGLLDYESFGRWGHGVDIDYAIRVRQAGGSVFVTESSYLNHMIGGTIRYIAPYNWEEEAVSSRDAGMLRKWGIHMPRRPEEILELLDGLQLGILPST